MKIKKNIPLIIIVCLLSFIANSQRIPKGNKIPKPSKIGTPTKSPSAIRAKKIEIQPSKSTFSRTQSSKTLTNNVNKNTNIASGSLERKVPNKKNKNSRAVGNFNSSQKKQLEIQKSFKKNKGNYTLPFKSNRKEANELGKNYVGNNHTISENGQAWISKDGLKLYRKPQYKKSINKTQANFQKGVKKPNGKTTWVSNAHLTIE